MRTDVELCRIIAAFGIVWFHSGNRFAREIAYGGLIYFAIVAAYFALNSNRTHRLTERAKRLLIPCGVWSIVYGAAHFVVNGRVFPGEYTWFSALFATPSIHLWFLPYLFLVLTCLDGARRVFSPKSIGLAGGLLAVVLLLSAPWWRQVTPVEPFGQWAHVTPAILIGLFLSASRLIPFPVRCAVACGIGGSLLYLVYTHESGVGVPYATGYAASLILLWSESVIPPNRVILKVSSASLGVYLVHPLLLASFMRCGIDHYGVPVLVFALSVLISLAIKKYVPRRIASAIL